MAPLSSIPLLSKSSTTSSTTTTSDSDETSNNSDPTITTISTTTSSSCGPHKPLAVLSGHHAGPISSLALCGEFLISASTGHDIILWQHPDLRPLTRFPSSSSGSVKSLAAAGNLVLTAHQDSRIRVWKLSRNPENIFKLIATLPTKKDFLNNFLKQSNYVQTRRNHRKLWIEHADTISCLAVHNNLIYSGSWDKTIKVWRLSDLKCIESIKAHDDAINGLVTHNGLVYSASADGKIKMWVKGSNSHSDLHSLKVCLEGHKSVCWNAVVVCEQGRLVYGGGSDGRVMGWEGEGEEWRVVCDVRAHERAVLCLCATGEFLCSGSADRSVGVWRRRGGGGGRLWRVGMIRGHEGPVKCLQASEIGVGEGFVLYSGGMDRSLRVWWVPKECGEEEEEEKKCVLLR